MAAWMAVAPGVTSTRRGRAHRPSSLGFESSAPRLPHLKGHVVAAGGSGGVVENGVATVIQVLLLGLICKREKELEIWSSDPGFK